MTKKVGIIGGGPVGMFASFELGVLGMQSIIIDALPHLGGQCMALYPQKPIYDIPGFHKITGMELIFNLQKQIEIFKPDLMLNAAVDRLSYGDNAVLITLKDSRVITVDAVIIASGGGLLKPNKPAVNDIEQFEDSSVIYSIKDKDIFKGKSVVIAGGGDSALDWVIELSDIAQSVALIHRRSEFKGADYSVKLLSELIKNARVKLFAPYTLDSILHNNKDFIGVSIRCIDTNECLEIKCDYLLPFFGLKSDSQMLKGFGVACSEDSKILVEYSTMQTSVPKVFAIGDIAYYNGKLKLILSGFSEAAIAAHAIYKELYNPKDVKFQIKHSTSNKVFVGCA